MLRSAGTSRSQVVDLVGDLSPRPVRNAFPSSLQRWRAARDRMLNGDGRARVILVGDSTGMGAGAGTGATGRIGARPKCVSAYLARFLTAAGIPAINQSLMGGSNRLTDLVTWDTRITAMQWNEGESAFGGRGFQATVNGNVMSWVPGVASDTMEVYYLKNSGWSGRTSSIDADGAGAASINHSGSAAAMHKQVYTTTLGLHTFNITRTGSGNSHVIGFVNYDSTTPAVDIINASSSGGTTQNWVWQAGDAPTLSQNGWAPLTNYAVLLPHAVGIVMGINDRQSSGITTTAYRANLQLMVDAIRAAGSDVFLVDPASSNPATVSYETQALYSAVLEEFSDTNAVPLISTPNIGGDYTFYSAQGMMFDSLHPEGSIYAVQARAISDLLAA